MLPIYSKTDTYEAERLWCLVDSPIYYPESYTFDYSEAYTSATDHPWLRSDNKFVVPSGVPVAVNTGGGANLVFPVKRTELAVAAPLGTEVSYTLVDPKAFLVGDNIFLAGGTARAIATINYATGVVTVATTIGVAGALADPIYTPNKDTAIGMLLNTADLSEGIYDIPLAVLKQGHVYFRIVDSNIIDIAGQTKTDLGTAGIRFIE